MHQQVLTYAILQFNPLFNQFWKPVIFHHQCFDLIQVMFSNKLKASFHIMSPQIFQETLNIHLHQQRNQIILTQSFQKHPVRIHMLYPFFSLSYLQQFNLVPCHQSMFLKINLTFGDTNQNNNQVNFHI